MAFNVNKIHIGAARIFVGVTNPTTGTPPTWMTHTAGVPATGTEIGLTEGDTTFEFLAKKEEIVAEQAYGPVDVWMSMESCKVNFTCQESNITALKAAFDNVGQFSDSSRDAFYFGTGTGAFSVTTQSVFFSSPRRDAPTKYFIGLMYKAYSSKGMNFPFTRTKKGTFAVEMVALCDLTRTAGDQTGQFFRELP